MLRFFVKISVLVLICNGIVHAQIEVLQPELGIRADPVVAGRLKIMFRRGIDAAEYNSILSAFGMHILYPVLPYERSLASQQNLTLIPGTNRLEALRIEEELFRAFVVEYTISGIIPEKLVSQLQGACSAFEVVETVVVSQILDTPNDPQINKQEMLNTIKAFDAWDVEPGSESVIIGISDSGINQEHEDLKDAIYVNVGEIPNNNIDDDQNGYIDDYRGYNFATKDDGTPPGITYNSVEGHGTGVSGISSASVNNGIGIAGVANKCKFFPFKTMPENIGGIVYGYESLLYSAQNGIGVVNCSWGSQSRSCIDSTIIAYVISRGVAVIGAAGNHGTSARFYPSSYPGVLGVGVSDQNDGVVSMTAFGPYVDIMAPGQNTWTTANDGTYTQFCCTSGAAPIVSGVVALVRARYPQLTPIEACALVREAVDEQPWTSIPENVDTFLLPRGRVNALKAVSLNPDSIPSLEYSETSYSSNSPDGRWQKGNTVTATTAATNTLGAWTVDRFENVRIRSAGSEPGITVNSISYVGDADLQKGDSIVIIVECAVTDNTDTTAFITGEIHGVTSAGDTVIRKFSIAVVPAPGYRDLQNDVVRISVGDRGRIGNTDLAKGQGSGLKYREWCGQLFEGGLLVSANGRLVDAVRAQKGINDHFAPVKKFVAPDPLLGIVRDSDAPDTMSIGVEVEQRVRLAEGDSGVYTSDITLTNISDTTLNDVSIAWFFDWDLGKQPAENTVYLFSYDAKTAIEGAASTDSTQPFVFCIASSDYSDAIGIAAGIDNSTTYKGFPPERKIQIMNSGGTTQFSGISDVAIMSGMKFLSPIPPGQQRKYTQVIVMDTNWLKAQEIVGRYTKRPQVKDLVTITNVFPLPSEDYIQIQLRNAGSSPGTLSIVDVRGRTVSLAEYPRGLDNILIHDITPLASGTYRIVITQQNTIISAPLVIVR